MAEDRMKKLIWLVFLMLVGCTFVYMGEGGSITDGSENGIIIGEENEDEKSE